MNTADPVQPASIVTSTIDEFIPTSQSALVDWMHAARERPRRAMYPAGGRTAWHQGPPRTEPGTTLCLSKLTQVVDYPARDMTVTVEAGIRLEELSRALAGEGQRLAVDVSEPHRATLGGAVATNTSGPRRFGLGTLRDYVIGVTAIDAGGRIFHAGGRVVKNVAGYDLCKMLTGSRGTLAVITQLTLKLKPLPESTACVAAGFESPAAVDAALEALLQSESRPIALEVLDRRAAGVVAVESAVLLPTAPWVLLVGIEGTAREVVWQCDRLADELRRAGPLEVTRIEGDPATRVWTALTEFAVPAEDPVTFKANLRPSRTMEFVASAAERGIVVQAHAGNGIVIGHLPDDVTSAAAAKSLLDPLRDLARAHGGNLVVQICDTTWTSVLPMFGAPEASACLMSKLKSQLDPRNVLNPHLTAGWSPAVT